MLTAAATAIGEVAPIRTDPDGALLSDRSQLGEVALAVARAVAHVAVADGVAPELDAAAIERAIDNARWRPEYSVAD
jgi:malic enzyme